MTGATEVIGSLYAPFASFFPRLVADGGYIEHPGDRLRGRRLESRQAGNPIKSER